MSFVSRLGLFFTVCAVVFTTHMAQASQITVSGDNARWLIKQIVSQGIQADANGDLVLTHQQCQEATYQVGTGLTAFSVISIDLGNDTAPVDSFIDDATNTNFTQLRQASGGQYPAIVDGTQQDIHAHYIGCNIQTVTCSLTVMD